MNIAQILLAFSVTHTLHSLVESASISRKLHRLKDALDGKKLEPYPANIDTRAKVWSITILFLFGVTALTYAILGLFNLSTDSLIVSSIALLVFIELFNNDKFDKFHVAIEPVINKFDKHK